MTKTMRIATVKATGDRYLVQQITIPRDGAEGRVHCWGEVIATKSSLARTREEALDQSCSTRHAGTKQFLRSAVDVSDEVVVTTRLGHELLAQARRNMSNVTGVSQSFRRAR